jgi:hypothetical protein
MSIFFAGTSLGDFSTLLAASNSTTSQMGPLVNEGILLNNPGGVAIAPFPSAQTDFWGTFYAQVGSNSDVMFEIRNGNTALYRYRLNGGINYIEAWNGSAWATWVQTLNSNYVLQNGNRTKVSVYLKMHATTGVFRIFLDQVMILEYIGNTILTAATSVDSLVLRATAVASANTAAYSALILANEDTRDLVFDQNQFSANSSVNTAWANDYVNVTKTGLSDLTVISSATAGQLETYKAIATDASIAGLAVKAVVVSARARKGDSGPQNLQMVARVGSTDYTTANIALPSAFDVRQGVFSTNPATGLPWTITEVNAAEFGVKSIA